MYVFDHVSLSSSYNEKYLIDQDVETVKTHILCLGTFFEYRAICEIMWRSIAESDRLQMTI